MTEQDVREGLSDAVEGEPPLDLDPDALVATARREVRRRRALVSASLATAALAVASVAVPVVLGASRNQVVAPAEQPASTAQQPATTVVRPQAYTAAQLTRRGEQMRDHIEATLADVVPGATKVAVQPFGGEAVGHVSDGQNYLNSFAIFTLDGTRFGIGVNTFAPGAHPARPDQCASVETDCLEIGDVRNGPVVLVGEENKGNTQLKIRSVYHFREDGSVVSAVGYNYDPTGGALPAVPELPVTTDQLRTLATDPALGL